MRQIAMLPLAAVLVMVSQSAAAGWFSSKCTAPPFVCGASQVSGPPTPIVCHPKSPTDPTMVCEDTSKPPTPPEVSIPTPPTNPSEVQPPLGSTCIPRVGAPAITINKLKFCD